MFAGIVFFDEDISISLNHKKRIKQHFSRYRKENYNDVDFGNAYFIYSAVGGTTDNFRVSHGTKQASFLAGEPLLRGEEYQNNLSTIESAIRSEDLIALSKVRGVFCGAFYWVDDEAGPIVSLCSDKLGIRPLYYYFNDSFLFFSTTFRLLEKLFFIPKKVDDDSMCQIVGFGFPLGCRTPYKQLYVVDCAELLNFKKGKYVRKDYWDWNDICTPNGYTKKDLLGNAYDLFKDAIRIRLKNEECAVSYLSGGMDSRAIVGVLSDMRIQTLAFNFSPSNSQDLEYARQFSTLSENVKFHSFPRDYDVGYNFRCELAMVLSSYLEKSENSFPNKMVWSGDGGSVGVGCVYLNETIVDLLESGDLAGAVSSYFNLNNINLPLNIINKKSHYSNQNLLLEYVINEIESYGCSDSQKLYMYLMLNDQRRHLHDFYEDIDLHRIEYLLPFWDSLFLELIFSIPVKYLLNHKFYTDWFYYFPSMVSKVPWQTYNGHMACPIESRKEFDYQWTKHRTITEKLKRSFSIGVDGITTALSRDDLGFFSKKDLCYRSLIHMSGLRDYAYAVRNVNKYRAYAKNTNMADFQ